MSERTITRTTTLKCSVTSASDTFDGRSEVLTEAESVAYQELLAEIEHLERLEDEQVAKSIRLATHVDEDWLLF